MVTKKKPGPKTLLYPMPALLVGAIVNEKPNFLTVAWGGIACAEPPALSVAIRKVRFSLKGIKENRIFSVNVPSVNLVRDVDYCGIYSGKTKDKSNIFKVFYGVERQAPLIEECPINLECKVLHIIDIGSHELVIGEILEVHINDDCIDDNGVPILEKINPLIYTPGVQEYNCLGKSIAKAYSTGKER